ncbi:protein SIEVE ELEMENT OCCLUSION B-like [Mercurialis annua]|uniref:protein SIEVE ELEMENT OCCLUSION B-like n=1 Tax=Mercurialis annua TaxID=3986 RepID=UPI0024AFC54F|nr:protein SIEVE ELEMENT OCCLUSION B-like [Mercurialis annua]
MIRWAKSSLLTDDEKIKKIMSTHLPNAIEIHLQPLLFLVETALTHRILQLEEVGEQVDPNLNIVTTILQAESEAQAQAQMEKEQNPLDPTVSLEIERILIEISYSTQSRGADLDVATLSIFDMVAKYSWETKLVLIMAAFALNYAQFSLLIHLYYQSTNPTIVKTKSIIKGLPCNIQGTVELINPWVDASNKLIKAMLDVTRIVVKFRELPSVYISPEASSLSAAVSAIPVAVYFTIRSVVACASQSASLANMLHGSERELSELADKLIQKYDDLNKHLHICNEHVEKKKNVEAYLKLLNCFDTANNDNMESIKALIKSKDGDLPLFNGITKKQVDINVLKRKSVLLLISNLNISEDELTILKLIFNESNIITTRQEHQYEVVWIPIIENHSLGGDEMETQFRRLINKMPWYSIQYPHLIEKVAVKLIQEVWHFKNNTILVALDPQGRVVSPYALHLLWIWGSNAFPFTRFNQESLWKAETWRLELLVDGVDASILRWIYENKYIFLYGGEDVEWVKTFIGTARDVGNAANIQLELVFVGNSSKREKIQQAIDLINNEKLNTSYWKDLTFIWLFWSRLESMLFSKIQLANNINKFDENDSIIQGIKKLLNHDKQGKWAILSKGSKILVNGNGNRVLRALSEYSDSPNHNFNLSFKQYYENVPSDDVHDSCCCFSFPVNGTRFPNCMICPECHRIMEKKSS